MDHQKAIAVARHCVLNELGGRALEVLKHAAPELAETWLWRGNALHQLARYDDAIDAARCGLAIEPDNSYLHHAVARAEFGLGHLSEAEAAILESLRLEPEEPEALALHAAILGGLGRRHAALKVIGHAEELAPELRSVRLLRAMLGSSMDDERDVRISRELLAMEPGGAEEHWWHALNLVRRGRLRDAADHFTRAAAINPANPVFTDAARVARHWIFWPLRVTSPILFWLAWYSILPLLLFAAIHGGVLWTAFWVAFAWSAYAFIYLLAHRYTQARSSKR